MTDVVRFEEDLQASPPEIALALSKAGVSGVQKAVRIRRGDAETVMAAIIDCTVDLAADQKGVHMSRFPELFEDAIDLVVESKAMQVEAILPNGQQQVLGHVNRFEFNWMNNYVFDDDYAPLLPKGTILKVTSWHDNTAANKNNPDPNQWVGWGDRTVDEMAHAWINITYMSDDDYTKEVEARKAKLATTTERQERQ